ncbi:hypothetical protein LINPERHAP2_LOCUS7101 [Linum perenne]
MKRSRFVLS